MWRRIASSTIATPWSERRTRHVQGGVRAATDTRHPDSVLKRWRTGWWLSGCDRNMPLKLHVEPKEILT